MENISKNPIILATNAISIVSDVALKLVNLQASLSASEVSVPLVLIWLIPLFCAACALSGSIQPLSKFHDAKRSFVFATSSVVFGFTSYLFVQLGFQFSFLVGFVFFLTSCVLVSSSVCLVRGDFRKVWRKRYGKAMLTLPLLLCFVVPLTLGLIQPAINDPSVVVSPSLTEMQFKTAGQQENLDVFVKSVEGYAWNIVISVETPFQVNVYVDGILNEVKRISYLEYDRVVTFPLRIATSFLIANGTYTVNIKWSYTSAFGHLSQKSTSILVFVGEIPSQAEFPVNPLLIASVIFIISAIAATLYSVRTRRRRL